MFDKSLAKEIIDEAVKTGGDFADLFVEEKRTTGIGCEAGKIEKVYSGFESGAGIRVISGEVTAYAYTNDLSREGLLNAAGMVSQAVQGKKKDVSLDLRSVKPAVDLWVEQRPDEVSTERKVEAVEAADRAARRVKDGSIRQVIVGYGDVVQKVFMANSEGECVEDERVRTRLVVQAVAARGPVLQTGIEAVGSTCGFEIFKDYPPEEVAAVAAKRAVEMLGAKPAPAGRMPVVLSGEAGGTMVHEACGHGLEADLVQKGLSVYAGKKGQEVASREITVVDDAAMLKKYGSYRFDDEGVPARKVALIEHGVLVDYLYDRLTAKKDGIISNGHGRRESYQHKPLPRMGNTYIAPGKNSPDEIIKEVKNGLLVKKMGGGQVNTATGDFVFDVAEGYLVEDGEVGPMVRGATLTGNGPQVLCQVQMVGNDLGFTIGTCGKDGQGVPVSDGQPTMLVGELVVGGTSHPKPTGRIRRI